MITPKTPADKIIFPLDVPSLDEARRLIELLAGHVGLFKVGLELFIRHGAAVINAVHNTSAARIFLDLKLHDIPATVSRAMTGIAELDVAFATVHCSENPDMLKGAVTGSAGKVGVLGVTVLTSVSSMDLQQAGYEKNFAADMPGLVLKRAAVARDAGCAGVVCSGLEVEKIKAALGSDFLAITPGIRPAWDRGTADDQKRITTPAEAIQKGADYIVIGRPIRDAADPQEAALRVAEEIAQAL